MREKTAEEVYNQFLAYGEYKITDKDAAVVKKMKLLHLKMQNILSFY